MTFARLWAVLAILLPVLGTLIANLSSVDVAYHLRAGDQILGGGGIPRTDTWTYTAAGAPWLDQQWGAQAILAAVYRVAGWTGLVILRAALVGLLFGLLFLACRLRGADIRRAAWLTLAAFLISAVALALRPQLFGMVLLAATLVLIAGRHRWPRLLWLVPIIVVAWANLHGSFFLGPVVVGLAWLEDLHDRRPAAWRTLAVAVVAALAAFVNPFGVEVWGYAVGLSTNSEVTARITEWQPTSLRTVPGMLFFGSALAGRDATRPSPRRGDLADARLARRVLRHRRLRDTGRGVVAARGGLCGRRARRRRPVEGGTRPLGRPVAGRGSTPSSSPPSSSSESSSCPSGVRPIPGLRAPVGVVGHAPPGVTAALREIARPGDRLFNPQPWGSWFEFALPDLPVALDSRIEVFPPQVWDDYAAVTDGVVGWEAILDRWGVTIVVVPADDESFVERLRAAGWNAAYADEDAVILTADGR